MNRTIEVSADAAGVARRAAELVTQIAAEAVAERGVCKVALSGGSTPEALYRLLADRREPFFTSMPWAKLNVFWGDERHVGPDDIDSNYRMTRLAMLECVPIPAGQVHRVAAENRDADAVAADYEKTMRDNFPGARDSPEFDLLLLGMGPDGHTASLFPDSPGLQEDRRWVIANYVEKFQQHRITITFPVINHARNILFLVTGTAKAPVLKQIFAGADLPAGRVQPETGKVTWLLDQALASAAGVRPNP